MKTAGIIGGMSWESSSVYYQLLNKEINRRMGGLHSAKVIINSLDFDDIEKMQSAGQWDKLEALMIESARALYKGGADFLMIGTNTMHKSAPGIEQAVSLPLLHIADAAAQTIRKSGISKVGLLGTRFTMEQDFYSGRLKEKWGIDVVVPDSRQRQMIDHVIYQELCRGNFRQESKDAYLEIMNSLVNRGAEAIVLGCTEIPLLVKQEDTSLPLINTMEQHVLAAVEWMLEGE